MNLAIDIGNTRLKAGLFDQHNLIETKVSTQPLSVHLIREWTSACVLDHIIIGSVRNLNEKVLGEIKSAFDVLIANQQMPLPINLRYETPKTLGMDRICGAVGAYKRLPKSNALVIDAGTCITYDLMTADGAFEGGAISPGLDMRLKAMHEFTDQLPLLEPSCNLIDIGTSTIMSMQMGSATAALFEMRGFISHFQEKYSNLKVILTGGDASFFGQHVENAIFAAPNLILEGLNEILLFNKHTE